MEPLEHGDVINTFTRNEPLKPEREMIQPFSRVMLALWSMYLVRRDGLECVEIKKYS
jgi:hypothetical protein